MADNNGNSYIKVSQLPEKETLTSTDYLIAEDLQDTWKIQASCLTEYMDGQIRLITESVNTVMEQAQSTLQDINDKQSELENSINEFNNAELQRQQNEAQRQQNETERANEFNNIKIYIESITDLDLPGQVSDLNKLVNEITTNEQTRQQNELQRQQNESTRQDIADELSDFLTTVEANEAVRVSAETTRQQNESTRQQNETERNNAYQDMLDLSKEIQDAEDVREQNETDRTSAYNTMISDFNELKQNVENAEAIRQENETNRENYMDELEEFAQNAENAENQRVSAETIRAQEFQEMKDFIDNFQYEISNTTKNVGNSYTNASTGTNNKIVFLSISMPLTNETTFENILKFGALVHVSEYDTSNALVNKCVGYISCDVNATTTNPRFSTLSVRLTTDSTCDATALWAAPNDSYNVMYVGYTLQTGNHIEYKLISDSSVAISDVVKITCIIYDDPTPVVAYPTSITPTTSENTQTITKPFGYEKYLFDIFNGANVASFMSSIYPVGSEYTTTSTDNPSTLFGGTWEMIRNGATRTAFTEIGDDGNPVETKVYTSYTWIRTE